MISEEEFKRQMSADMVSGEGNNMADIRCKITANGVFVIPVGGEAYGFKNIFSVPVELHIRDGTIQTYSLMHPVNRL